MSGRGSSEARFVLGIVAAMVAVVGAGYLIHGWSQVKPGLPPAFVRHIEHWSAILKGPGAEGPEKSAREQSAAIGRQIGDWIAGLRRPDPFSSAAGPDGGQAAAVLRQFAQWRSTFVRPDAVAEARSPAAGQAAAAAAQLSSWLTGITAPARSVVVAEAADVTTQFAIWAANLTRPEPGGLTERPLAEQPAQMATQLGHWVGQLFRPDPYANMPGPEGGQAAAIVRQLGSWAAAITGAEPQPGTQVAAVGADSGTVAPAEAGSAASTSGTVPEAGQSAGTLDGLQGQSTDKTQGASAQDTSEAQTTTAAGLPAADTGETPASQPEADAVTDAEPAPQFQMVQVDAAGHAVVAGVAAPGAAVTVTADGELLGTTVAEAGSGHWVLTPERRLPPGEHKLSLSATTAGGAPIAGADFRIVVEDRATVMAKAEQGTGDDDQAAAWEKEAADVTGTRVATPELPAESVAGSGNDMADTSASDQTAEQPTDAGQQTAQADMQTGTTGPGSDATTEGGTATTEPVGPPQSDTRSDAEKGLLEKAGDMADAVSETFSDILKNLTGSEPKAADRQTGEIYVAGVSIKDGSAGPALTLSGRAPAGAKLRVLLNGAAAGETTADADGRWMLEGIAAPGAGKHVARIERIGEDGSATAFAELNFEQSPPAIEGGSVTVAVLEPPVTVPAEEQPTQAEREQVSFSSTTYVVTGERTGTLTVSGRGVAGARINLSVDDAPIASTEVDANGRWLTSIERWLEPGQYVVTAEQVDGNGAFLSRAKANVEVTKPPVVVAATETDAAASASESSGTSQAAASSSAGGSEAGTATAGTSAEQAGSAADTTKARERAKRHTSKARAQTSKTAKSRLAKLRSKAKASAQRKSHRTRSASRTARVRVWRGADGTETLAVPRAVRSRHIKLRSFHRELSFHAGARWYRVKKGDTLWRISRRFYGTPKRYMRIYHANRAVLTSPHRIYPRQRLRIP